MKPHRNIIRSNLNYLFAGVVCAVVVGLLYFSLFGNGDFLIDLILGPVDSGQEVVSKPDLPSKVTEKQSTTIAKKPTNYGPPVIETNKIPQPPAIKRRVGFENKEEEPQAEPPLTDIAPEPPVVDVRADEHPTERIKRMNLGVPPQYTKPVKLPRNMNLQRPPRWNKTLASPAVPKEAPDPFTPPPIKVDPRRRPQEDVERLTIGQ